MRKNKFFLKLKIIISIISLSLFVFITSCTFSKTKNKKVKKSSSIKFIYSFPKALELSNKKNKPILINFYTDWCHWCKKLEVETFNDSTVKKVLTKFILLKINGDENFELTSKYLITGYPTVLFLDKEGNELSRVDGFLEANDFLLELQVALKRFGGR